MKTLILIGVVAWWALFALIGLGFTLNCILRGLGSVKGCPLPKGWWMQP